MYTVHLTFFATFFVSASFASLPLMQNERLVVACTLATKSGVITYNQRLFQLLLQNNHAVQFIIAHNSPLLDSCPKRLSYKN